MMLKLAELISSEEMLYILEFISFQFEVEINNYSEEGMYILSFHNCYNFENKRSQAAINITVSIRGKVSIQSFLIVSSCYKNLMLL